MMKRFKQLFFLSFFFLLMIPKVYASEDGNFSVSPLNPETGEPQSSYYDLKVEPGDEIALEVTIMNSSSKEMKIKVEANNATTNSNGITSYLKSEERDSSLKVSFEDMVTIENDEITVVANSNSKAVIVVTVPDESFQGEILGGLRFSEIKEKQGSDNERVITNNITYTVGVLLRESENQVDPEMVMHDVITEQRNYRNYISVNMQNRAPRMIQSLKIKAQVFDKKTNELRYEASNDSMRMAPNSNFYFGISLEDKKFVPGEYMMAVEGEADGSNFSFNKTFTISSGDVREYNRNSVFSEDNNSNFWLYIILIGIGILIIFLLSFLFKRRRPQNEK
ncbi:DUF916 and DUF3324 domain-containing protein [Enterococcus sp. CR-Ec1]|uniref:DUF916 and DUF3324 domain-containing protein n=1 Tax=Enterococcus sp. CR-Ec1 TaxID=2057791 RepID=UPI000C7593F1|nr:DUF916 and DUF3324 domain-containing protein [Enterococcus sp. CR-Ec1]AUJ87416.1 hypothetical protein CXM95_18435 [Enterococcus sp. CR-Ec1]